MSQLLGVLRDPAPTHAVELRPPRSGLDASRSMDVWIDMHHGIRRLSADSVPVFLTDDAVGASEEESLAHLSANLGGGAALETVVPFLTCKHSLEYCRMFARRAATLGVGGLAVVGGDDSVGPPRCVPHGSHLRRILREEVPGLPLGGWCNPHRDAAEQVGWMAEPGFSADFALTQVVSHHVMDRVGPFLDAVRQADITVPVVVGVFYYRSGNPRTLDRLGAFFPVPVAALSREFAAGDSPDLICARTVHALRRAGVSKVYVSNLSPRGVSQRLAAIEAEVQRLEEAG
ncbi:MAG: hypothetical protein HKN73_13085 [Gemmatimonadetes bacterium]|nr:hypothetical protein [Gemmatimonadota bacterium]